MKDFKSTEVELGIKAKDTIYRLVFRHVATTQPVDVTQALDSTLALTAEPQQRPDASGLLLSGVTELNGLEPLKSPAKVYDDVVVVKA